MFHAQHPTLTSTKVLVRVGELRTWSRWRFGVRRWPYANALDTDIAGCFSPTSNPGCEALATIRHDSDNQVHAQSVAGEIGVTELYNNIVVIASRALGLDQTNCLFTGADGGGERAVAMYSMIGSCKARHS